MAGRPKVERITLQVLRQGAHEWTPEQKPRTRGECVNGLRPCPWVSCRYHLALEVTDRGDLIHRYQGPIEELEHSCALDIADAGGHNKAEVGRFTNLSKERVRQIEDELLPRLKPLLNATRH